MEVILLLGGYGFLGSNIIDYAAKYHKDKYRFIVFDFYGGHPLNVKFDNISKAYKADFTNIEDMRTVFEENKIDYIFHLISTTVPATSNNNVTYDIESNLVPTINILELARHYAVKNIVYISSGGAIYGTSAQFVHKEEDPLQPISSYGIIKLAVEKYLRLYNHLYGINYLALRLSNPYGAFHTSQKQGLINIALRKAINGEDFEVWGDGTNIKDYIYAEDVARIVFILLEQNVVNQVLNIGSNKGYAINEILAIIKEIVPSFRVKYQNVRSFDVPQVILDTGKLKKYIDFELLELKTGINRTYQWIQEHQHSL